MQLPGLPVIAHLKLFFFLFLLKPSQPNKNPLHNIKKWNHPFLMGAHLIILFICTALIPPDSWFILSRTAQNTFCPGRGSLPDLFSVIQALRLWQRSPERQNMCSLLFGYISFCLRVLLSPVYTHLFSPLPCVAFSSLFILHFARTISSSGTLTPLFSYFACRLLS